MSWTDDCSMRCFSSKNHSRKIDAGSESPIGAEEFLNYITPQCKKDIMKNRKLKGLLEECLGNCLQTKVIIAELQQGVARTAKLKSMYEQQEETLEKLDLRKKKLDKKLKRVPAWRKVSTVTLRSAFAGALISSIVAASLTAPPVAAALSAAGAIPLEQPMRKWVDSLWKKYEKVLEGQKASVSCMEEATDLAMKDLADLIERLENSA